MKNVAIKGPMKAFRMSLSNFLNTLSLINEVSKNKAFGRGAEPRDERGLDFNKEQGIGTDQLILSGTSIEPV
jgi:hypothetical protein